MGAQPATLRRPSGQSFAWAGPLVPIALAGFFLSALSYYHVQMLDAGADGLLQALVVGAYRFLGFVPGFMLCLMVLVWGSIWFLTGELARPWNRALRVGIEAAQETLAALRGRYAGAYLMPSFGRFEVVAEVLEALR